MNVAHLNPSVTKMLIVRIHQTLITVCASLDLLEMEKHAVV